MTLTTDQSIEDAITEVYAQFVEGGYYILTDLYGKPVDIKRMESQRVN